MTDDRLESRTRDFDFTLTRSEEDGDGLNLEGTVAVFNTPARINDRQGQYDEIIAPGAFKQAVRSGRPPILMFNHGMHPIWKDMPIGKVTDWYEDRAGLQMRARLLGHDFFAPIREAITEKAITGMSFRFDPVKGRNDWQIRAKGEPPLCTRREIRPVEFGPCITPAYVDTSMALRSIVSGLEQSFPGVMSVQILGETRDGLDDDETNPRDLVTEAVATHWSLRDPLAWVDMYDGYMVFGVGDNDISKHRGLWRVDYTIADGAVSLSEPTQLELTPAGAAPRSEDLPPARTEDLGTSDDAVPMGTSEDAAVEQVRTGPLSLAERQREVRLMQLRRRGITRKAANG